jgi:primosomal protein N' (replication factor Y) (superfamily II helicase)
VDRPVLSLDRPFTYELPEELGAGVGSLVRVPFHGKLVRGWVLGPTDDVPARLLPVKRLGSPVRFFDERMLELLRWVSDRYVAPLASVIARSHPPRVASEEVGLDGPAGLRSAGQPPPNPRSAKPADPPEAPGSARHEGSTLLDSYRGGRELSSALDGGSGAFLVRPAPGDDQRIAVEAVGVTIAGGRTAVVLVPGLDPLPATAAAVLERFEDRTILFAGGSRRARYRMWLDIQAGRCAVVVGTRPAVFAPLPRLGLIFVSRESHVGHREERSPYYHVRDVAAARAGLSGATCVAASLCPSAEAAAAGWTEVEKPGRRWPPVEVVRPGPEGRAPRLLSALKSATRAFLYEPLPGFGIARVCRACGEPAACAACGGMLRAEGGAVRCAVCGAPGRCRSCGASDFGIAPGGAERVEDWARRVASVPVRRIGPTDRPSAPAQGEVLVGGAEAVRDFGPLALDLVGILDADLASRRAGLASSERALATWMEAAAWAGPRGRVIVQTRQPGDPAVQALVAGNPRRFYRTELPRRADAGFPAGWPVFRVTGGQDVAGALDALGPRTMLVSGGGDETVCLLALDPGKVQGFGRTVRDLAERGIVTRVEAEPHL